MRNDGLKFYIADAFTERIFGGNPAGVVILEDGSDFPAEEVMVKTAAELRYSETAFIRRRSENEFQIRYFTPAAEVDLCGHATIGAFSVLLDAGFVKVGCDYINDTLAGRLTVSVMESSILMDMGKAVFLERIEDREALKELYGVMGLEYRETMREEPGEELGQKGGVGTEKRRLLPELVSTGLPDIMLPVGSREELSAIRPDFKALAELSERYQVVGVHAFALAGGKPGGRDAGCERVTAYCRNFAPLYGIDEEAATGTANGALTYYLYRNGLLREGDPGAFLQGEDMGRPSRIVSEIKETDGALQIRVGGQAAILARGEIFLLPPSSTK